MLNRAPLSDETSMIPVLVSTRRPASREKGWERRIRGRRIRGRRIGKTNTSETRTKWSTEITSEMSTEKQSTEKSTEKSTEILQKPPIMCAREVNQKVTDTIL